MEIIFFQHIIKTFGTPEKMSPTDHFNRHLAEDVFLPLEDGMDKNIGLGDQLISYRDGEYLVRGYKDLEFERERGAHLFLQKDVSSSPDVIPGQSIVFAKDPIFINAQVERGNGDNGHKYVKFGDSTIESLDKQGEFWPAKEVIALNKKILEANQL